MVSQFANDMVIWVSGNDVAIMEEMINLKLVKMKEFLENRNLTFSPEKSEAVLFNENIYRG